MDWESRYRRSQERRQARRARAEHAYYDMDNVRLGRADPRKKYEFSGWKSIRCEVACYREVGRYSALERVWNAVAKFIGWILGEGI